MNFYVGKQHRCKRLFENRPYIGRMKLKDIGLGGSHNGVYEAFRRSCIVMREAWDQRDGE